MEQYKIEELYKKGKMPKWIYYQQINKPSAIKLQEQKKEFYNHFMQTDIEESIEDQVENVIEDLFKDFHL